MKFLGVSWDKYQKMGQKATNTAEQIAILTKRGMVMDLPIPKIEEVLKDIGYYRLGFYWYPLTDAKTHDFIYNIKFSEALSLYYFDTDLKNILTKYLTRLEINFRTKLIYIVSNAYPYSPTWFVDPAIVEREFIQTFDKFYSREFKQSNKAIKKHHEKYINDKYAPAWKTIEFLTFGSVLHLYRSIKSKAIKELIANEYQILNTSVLEAHIKIILNLRNICAHNGVLYDFKTTKGIKNIPGLNINTNERHSLTGVFKLFGFYLSKISKNRSSEFEKSILDLKNNMKLNLEVRAIIAENIGLSK
jgi:abortive infection bacteriophage resistance protein